jgi:hypothetical protein
MAAKKTLYEILGLEPDANELDIGLAFQRRSLEIQRSGNPDPNELALVTQAHDVLANPKRRAAYDATRVTASEKAAAASQAPDLIVETDADDEEGSGAKKKLIPVVGIGVAIALAIFLWAKSGHPPEAPKAEQAQAPAPPPPPPPPPKALKEEDILASALRAVGRVESFDMSGKAAPLGLALVTEPGHMITTCHGIPAAAQLVVAVGKEQLSATLTITDEVLDLCKLQVAGLGAAPLAIAADEPKMEQKIYALGANAKGEFALTEGTIRNVRALPAGKALEVSMPIAASASGGAIFDTYGKLVAIATAGSGGNVAIPASWIAQMRTRPRDAK